MCSIAIIITVATKIYSFESIFWRKIKWNYTNYAFEAPATCTQGFKLWRSNFSHSYNASCSETAVTKILLANQTRKKHKPEVIKPENNIDIAKGDYQQNRYTRLSRCELHQREKCNFNFIIVIKIMSFLQQNLSLWLMLPFLFHSSENNSKNIKSFLCCSHSHSPCSLLWFSAVRVSL